MQKLVKCINIGFRHQQGRKKRLLFCSMLACSIILFFFSCSFGREDPIAPEDPQVYTEVSINGLDVSFLKVKDKIALSWEPVFLDKTTLSYSIHRYNIKNILDNSEPEQVYYVDTNFFEDTMALKNILYYYKVFCRVNGQVIKNRGLPKEGVFTDSIDSFENNNSDFYIKEKNSSTFLAYGELYESVMFICKDKQGEIVTDVDWYKYMGTPQTITLKVVLDAESFFCKTAGITCKAAVYFNDNYNAKFTQDINHDTKEVTFSDFIGIPKTEIVEVYFKIFIVIDEEKFDINQFESNVFESYKIGISLGI